MGCGKSKIVEPVHQSHVVDRCSTKHGSKDEKTADIKKDVFHGDHDESDDDEDILEVGLHKGMLCTIEEAESENDDDDDEEDSEDLSFYSAEDEPNPKNEIDQPAAVAQSLAWPWHVHTNIKSGG